MTWESHTQFLPLFKFLIEWGACIPHPHHFMFTVGLKPWPSLCYDERVEE
jgi:hypothetical protein